VARAYESDDLAKRVFYLVMAGITAEIVVMVLIAF
jgi:hypothetical protein